jgi:hypothetical protein
MDRYAYPHTIESGAGERFTFLRRLPGPRGDRLEIENLVKPRAGPPMHVHHYQEEALTGVTGKIGYECKGDREHTGSGTLEPTMCGARVRRTGGLCWTSRPRCSDCVPSEVAVGRRIGKYRNYADAPEPVRR